MEVLTPPTNHHEDGAGDGAGRDPSDACTAEGVGWKVDFVGWVDTHAAGIPEYGGEWKNTSLRVYRSLVRTRLTVLVETKIALPVQTGLNLLVQTAMTLLVQTGPASSVRVTRS